jgi:HEAT repeat protein
VARRRSYRQQLTRAISSLGLSDPHVVQASREQVLSHGDAAVPALIEALDADDEALRQSAASTLGLLGDPRATSAVAALLHDASSTVRRHAAEALARLAPDQARRALVAGLRRESSNLVRLEAVRSLVRLAKMGHDEALPTLLDRLSDEDENARVRTASMEVIVWIADARKAAPARALLERLANDANAQVRAKARRMLDAPPKARLESWALERLLEDLGSPNAAVWRRSIPLLQRAGASVVEPSVRAMLARPDDEVFAQRVVMALRNFSGRQLARLGPYLDTVVEPAPLNALVALVAAAPTPSLLSRLRDLIARLAHLDERAHLGVRANAHLALARSGSRLAAEDLRTLLERKDVPPKPALIEAASIVGTRAELKALVRAYTRTRGIDRLSVRDAVLRVMRREKIRRNDRIVTELSSSERSTLEQILGPSVAAKPRVSRRLGLTGLPLSP